MFCKMSTRESPDHQKMNAAALPEVLLCVHLIHCSAVLTRSIFSKTLTAPDTPKLAYKDMV